jgi:hypothetical protein
MPTTKSRRRTKLGRLLKRLNACPVGDRYSYKSPRYVYDHFVDSYPVVRFMERVLNIDVQQRLTDVFGSHEVMRKDFWTGAPTSQTEPVVDSYEATASQVRQAVPWEVVEAHLERVYARSDAWLLRKGY